MHNRSGAIKPAQNALDTVLQRIETDDMRRQRSVGRIMRSQPHVRTVVERVRLVDVVSAPIQVRFAFQEARGHINMQMTARDRN